MHSCEILTPATKHLEPQDFMRVQDMYDCSGTKKRPPLMAPQVCCMNSRLVTTRPRIVHGIVRHAVLFGTDMRCLQPSPPRPMEHDIPSTDSHSAPSPRRRTSLYAYPLPATQFSAIKSYCYSKETPRGVWRYIRRPRAFNLPIFIQTNSKFISIRGKIINQKRTRTRRRNKKVR